MRRAGIESIPLPDLPLWHNARARRVPLAFELELTARCDNNCRHCYINLPQGDASAADRELTVAEIDDLAAQAAGLGALWCLATGGEPLLREDFPEIYLGLRRRGLLVSVFTNGCLIDERIAALFRRHPPRDVEITVYGATRATYESVTRVPGSYGRFRAGLARLERAGITPRLKAVFMESNRREMPAIAEFCREHTRDYFRFDTQLHLRYDRNQDRNREIIGQRLPPREIAELERSDRKHHRAMIEHCDRLLPRGGRPAKERGLFFCRAGLDGFTIGWDGSFKLCGSLTDPACTYDLRTGALREAWDSFVPSVRRGKPGGRRPRPSCAGCELVNLCLWCPAHAYLETGKPDRPVKAFCEAARARRSLLPN